MPRHSLILLLFMCFALSQISRAEDRVLLVGTNTYANAADTPGCEEDARALERVLKNRFGFARGSIKMLLGSQATAANIDKAVKTWLIEGTKEGDRIFFFYAGHGAQAPDDNGDEKDGKDEVMAPYDVLVAPPGVPTDNFIRDDQINEWLAELLGRRVVFAFDSCHSGTISRGLGGKKPINSRFLRMKTAPVSRGAGDVYSTVPSSGGGRDLGIVKEKSTDGLVNGAVVLSAASPYQEAQPVGVNGEYRGAFSYLLEQALDRGEQMPVGEIATALKTGMKRLAVAGEIPAGRNGEFQAPDVEYAGNEAIANLPLWWGAAANAGNVGANAAAPAALYNPQSDLKVKFSMLSKGCDTGKPATCRPVAASPPPKYAYEDLFAFDVNISGAGEENVYLYVLIFSQGNEAACVFPAVNGDDTDNQVSMGNHRFPRQRPGKPPYEVFASAPEGFDVWVALVSRAKLKLGEKEKYTWEEVFSRLGIPELQKVVSESKLRMRGAGARVQMGAKDWQAATFVVETRPTLSELKQKVSPAQAKPTVLARQRPLHQR